MMQALTPLVEPVSIDEAYLDLSGTETLHSGPPAMTLLKLQQDIKRKIGITVSIGLSANKFLAKTASDMDKPDGFSVLSPHDAAEFLAPLPPQAIHGVGKQFSKRLEQAGYATIADLQNADVRQLMKAFGDQGLWLKKRASGIDDRPVDPGGNRKSVSSETTFDANESDLSRLTDCLWRLSRRTADRAKAAGCQGYTVTLKLKTADFKTISRQSQLGSPTQLAQTIFRTAQPLLKKEADGRQFRLLGVGLSGLSDALPGENQLDIGDLADPKAAKRAAAERAMDKARQRFGRDMLDTGRGLKPRKG